MAAGRTETMNIRVEPRQRGLIDRAAAATGKTRSAFMLDAATRSAQDVLLDQTVFALDAERWRAFSAALDRAPADNPQLKRLLHTRAPWD